MTQPALSDFAAHVTSLIGRGEHYRAWVEIRDRLQEPVPLPVHHLVSQLADQLDADAADLRPARVALLGSFTLGPLVPMVRAHALAARLLADVYVGDFNVWQQEALSPDSGLRRFNPDVIFLALRAEDLAPRLVHDFLGLSKEEVGAELAAAAEALETFLSPLRRWSRARVVIHAPVCPVYPALGILDHESPEGQSAAFREWNQAWTDAAWRAGDAWVLDCHRLVREVGWDRWRDARFWALAKLPLSTVALERLAKEYAKYLRAFFGLARKVLVLDLDNTLWGGILGEDGFHGIQLGAEYPGSAFVELQRVIRTLHDRGIILAINSKNNPEEALQVLEQHPAMALRADHFAGMKINWNDKAANLEELAEELNLGLDTFVYVDDSAVECERVRQALPHVLTVHMGDEPALRPDRLRRLAGVFDTLEYSPEDHARTAMYRADGARKQLMTQAPSLEDFYASLDMELSIAPLDPTLVPRAAQLTQRTNQFNLTTRRYTESEMAALLNSPDHEVYAARLRDRFGDNGVIALAILRAKDAALYIDTFLMSCRVIGRTVETALLTFLLRRARELGAREVVGEYRATKKNALVADFYARHDFKPGGQLGPDTLWRLTAEHFSRPQPAWFRLHTNHEGPNT